MSNQTNMASIADCLLALEKNLSIKYFQDLGGNPYVQIIKDSVYQVLKIEGQSFKAIIRSELRKANLSLNKNKLDELFSEVEAKCFDNETREEVFIRIGHDQEKNILIDCSNGDYVIISPGKFEINKIPSVKFLSLPKQKPLPFPQKINRKDFLKKLRPYFNLKEKDEIHLVLAFVLKLFFRYLNSSIILVWKGSKDSGKSTSSETVKMLVDPTEPLLLMSPHSVEDVIYSLNSSYFCAYDNLSGMKASMADMFCSIVYGVGFSKRKLYTDDFEKSYNIRRDLMFNSIVDLTNRSDFNDRIIEIKLESIMQEKRISKTELQERLNNDLPYLFYGILDLLKDVLVFLPKVQTTNLPRMADYARIGIAMESALGLPSGKFMEIYYQNLNEKKEASFWDDAFCSEIYSRLYKQTIFDDKFEACIFAELANTPHRLLLELSTCSFKKDSWRTPIRDPAIFGRYLSRIEGSLKHKGILVSHTRTAKERIIRISLNEQGKREMYNSYRLETQEAMQVSGDPDL